MIDDDNAPAPENIPTPSENTDGIFGEWEHSEVASELWLEDAV